MTPLPAVLAFALLVAPGDTDAELARLRKVLGLAADVHLRLAESAALPEAAARTVALEAGLDTRVRDNVARWTEEWKKLAHGATAPWLKEASLLADSGRLGEASRRLQQASRLWPDDEEVMSRLAAASRIAQPAQPTSHKASTRACHWGSL